MRASAASKGKNAVFYSLIAAATVIYIATINFVRGSEPLAIVDRPLAG